jgi:hypothetical protein
MRNNPSIRFLIPLFALAVLAGCAGMGDILGGDPDRRDPYDPNDRYETVTDLRGTVERVDTRDRFIVVDAEGTGRYNLRNEGDGEVVLYYDDRTVVEYQGRTYRPADLERGDRIAASVEQSGSRLIAEQIEVLYDVTSGGVLDGDRGDRLTELRGVVRYVDTRSRVLEIEPSDTRYGQGDVVRVDYDADTIVEFEGRRYQPENLERGDLVEIELRDFGDRRVAREILVIEEVRARG